MTEMISVRIPKGLRQALEEYTKNQHYLDISEAVRDYLRKKIHKTDDPYLAEVKKLRESITKNIKEKALRQSRQALLAELKKIDTELRGDLS